MFERETFFFFFLRLYGHGLRPVDKALKWLVEPAGLDEVGLDVKKNMFIKRGRFGFWG